MKLTRTIAGLCLLAVSFVFQASYAEIASAQQPKLATVNLPEVFKNLNRGKAVEQEMMKMQTDSQAKSLPLREAVGKIRDQLKAGKDTLKQEERDKLTEELKNKTEELQTEEQSLRIKLAFKQKTIQNVMANQIREVIDKLAKDEGLTAVFGSQSLLYSGGMVDLTEKVTKALDAMPALEKDYKE